VTVFAAYAKYYDLLYRDKDYSAEAQYVVSKLRSSGSDVESILELGCGTGAHACLIAEQGFSVHGVDMSQEMLNAAEDRRGQLPARAASAMSVSLGDVRTVRLGRTFDAVISLFHVFSYQTSNEDLRAAFETARVHLKPGGVLFFDCWYGPAVLTIGASTKVKRFDDRAISVTRIAEPAMRVNENMVDVNYDVLVTEKETGMVHRIAESHHMRYLFVPEIRRLCADVGMELIDAFEWMSDEPPNSRTWAACFVARG
jgi:SAM-dependent methyltransferase